MKSTYGFLASMTVLATAHSVLADDGRWTFGGRVGANSSSGVTRTEMALNGEYVLGNMLTWRTDVAFVFRDAKQQDVFDINIPTNLLFWPTGRTAKFRPYLGPGANYSRSHEGNSTFGFNALAGLQLASTSNTTFGIEGKYLIPDITDPSSKPQTSLSMTGAFQFAK